MDRLVAGFFGDCSVLLPRILASTFDFFVLVRGGDDESAFLFVATFGELAPFAVLVSGTLCGWKGIIPELGVRGRSEKIFAVVPLLASSLCACAIFSTPSWLSLWPATREASLEVWGGRPVWSVFEYTWRPSRTRILADSNCAFVADESG